LLSDDTYDSSYTDTSAGRTVEGYETGSQLNGGEILIGDYTELHYSGKSVVWVYYDGELGNFYWQQGPFVDKDPLDTANSAFNDIDLHGNTLFVYGGESVYNNCVANDDLNFVGYVTPQFYDVAAGSMIIPGLIALVVLLVL